MGAEPIAGYIEAFRKRRSAAPRTTPAWLNERREAAIQSFSEQGFPSVKKEAWRFTNVQPLVALPYGDGDVDMPTARRMLESLWVRDEAARLVFLNGRYAPDLSHAKQLPAGAQAGQLSAVMSGDGAEWLSSFGHAADDRRNGFVALNTALFTEGAIVRIPPGCRVSRPIQLVYASAARGQPVISYPRTMIVLGAGSEASIVESYLGNGGGTYLCNAVTELAGGEGAVAQHYRIQREGPAGSHVGLLAASLARDCSVTAHAVTLSGNLVRNDVHVALRGAGAQCELNGLYVSAGREHVDNFTEIEHLQPRASSRELYKGILDGASRAVFNGKIVVHKDAQKTDARQTNKNLLLSPQAVVNTNPQLEIYADDVKCSHGSSIGQLDPDALFYLRARGLGPDEARNLLRFAFASEVVGRIKIESLRTALDEYLAAKLRG